MRVFMGGAVSREEFDAVFAEVYRLEAERDQAPDRITDISTVTSMETGYEQMLPMARKRSKHELPNPLRNALIAVTPMQFGMARMFQSLNTNPKIELRIVGTMDEALAWLAGRPEPSKP